MGEGLRDRPDAAAVVDTEVTGRRRFFGGNRARIYNPLVKPSMR
jgi:hypothetical protein